MIICQTLWTNKRNLLEESFGWSTPQHHLMSWALSCLRLKKNYTHVHLYSDEAGIDLLINKLHLPYNLVFDDYSDLNCQRSLWALPKLLTYRKQQQPFLHVDGDVIINAPFEKSLFSSRIVAQNLEIGTEYYKTLFNPLVRHLKYLPGPLKENMVSNNLKAYNAGVIGGNDIAFFKKYVDEAIKIVTNNNDCSLDGNFNILFEQVLLYSMAFTEKKEVACVLNDTFKDSGYELKKVADFTRIHKLKYLHLLGPHKRNKEVCDLLERYLYKENEEVFRRIISLFKKRHYFYNSKIANLYPLGTPGPRNIFLYEKTEKFIKLLNAQFSYRSNAHLKKCISLSKNVLLKELFNYEQKINRLFSKFNRIAANQLKQLELFSLNSIMFFSLAEEDKFNALLKVHPFIEIINSPFDWTTWQIDRDSITNLYTSIDNVITIGIIPGLFLNGYKEVALDQMCVNMMILANQEIALQDLMNKTQEYLPDNKDPNEKQAFYELFLKKVEFLIINKVLLITSFVKV